MQGQIFWPSWLAKGYSMNNRGFDGSRGFITAETTNGCEPAKGMGSINDLATMNPHAQTVQVIDRQQEG